MKRFSLIAILFSAQAYAYGFMLKHDYTACAQCHVDPSGGSLVTPYGRAQSELLLRTRYGAKPEREDAEPGKAADFLFGLFSPPEELLLGGDLRGAAAFGLEGNPGRVFPMQLDVTGAVRSGKLTAAVSLGVGSAATAPANLLGKSTALVSRHHWVGYSPDEDGAFMVRAGRMALPFGLRLPEHTSWVRAETRTDANVSQQHGLSLVYAGEHVRTEVMGMVGNLGLTPPEYRERGYSGFLEWNPKPFLGLGVSSLLTHADNDVMAPGQKVFRHAHGVFTRVALGRAVMLQAEADMTWVTHPRLGGDWGLVALVQADIEPLQGLHFLVTGELKQPSLVAGPTGLGGWGSVWWFFAPHTDVRLDVMTRFEPSGRLSTSLLAQLHFFL
ncbi:MAG: hypothetical protein K1X64_22240 [Myxococcaceae bacterium]|nr:hypothetical protein [Myxococcaceae bacterium]